MQSWIRSENSGELCWTVAAGEPHTLLHPSWVLAAQDRVLGPSGSSFSKESRHQQNFYLVSYPDFSVLASSRLKKKRPHGLASWMLGGLCHLMENSTGMPRAGAIAGRKAGS